MTTKVTSTPTSKPLTPAAGSDAAAANGSRNGAVDVLLHVSNLKMHFPITKGIVFQRQVGAIKAVDGINFDLYRGETLGLVGESGCGKSTTGRAILQLYRPTEGQVVFEGKDLTQVKGEELRKMRRRMQMIFQDPYASLNPRMTVGSIIGEPLEVHNIGSSKKERQDRVQELLKIVNLNPYFINRYPHEFSGGQRQRIGIAACPGGQPVVHRLRRADLGARRIDPGADHQPAGRSAGRVWPDLSFYRP